MRRQHASTVRRGGGSFDRDVIYCKNPDCDQIIATRDGWGKPLAPYRNGSKYTKNGKPPWTIERDGRLSIRCESCNTRNRLIQTTRLSDDETRAANRYMKAQQDAGTSETPSLES